MANNINQIKATIEANLAKIRAAYLAELAANPTAEGAATARTNYAAALKSAQLNAQTLIANQSPFESETEYKLTDALLGERFPLGSFNFKRVNPPNPTKEEIYAFYGFPLSDKLSIGGEEFTIWTNSNANLPVQFIPKGLSGIAKFANKVLPNLLIDDSPLPKYDIVFGTGGGSGSSGNGPILATGQGSTGGTGHLLPCLYAITLLPPPLSPCPTDGEYFAPKGPSGQIIGDDGREYFPFNPITNTGGYIHDRWYISSNVTRKITVICENDGGSASYDLPPDFNFNEREGEQKVPGYEPKPFYNPAYPRNPFDPSIGRWEGPEIIETSERIRHAEKTYRCTDPVTGKECLIVVEDTVFCEGVHIVGFSNWGEGWRVPPAKPKPGIPEWTDGPIPPGFCEALRRWNEEHPNEKVIIPLGCGGTGGGTGTIIILPSTPE